MRKCDFCQNADMCSGVRKRECVIGDYKDYSPEPDGIGKDNMVNAVELINKILQQPSWLDGTVLVVNRDAIIDIIDKMRR